MVTRRRGDWDRSEAYFNEAERLDPRNASVLAQHALSYVGLRRFPEALRKYNQILNIIPDDMDAIENKAAIAQAEGDLPRAAELLAPLHANANDSGPLVTQLYQTILERRPGPVLARVQENLAKPNSGNVQLRFWLGWAQEAIGDHTAAQETWRRAQDELERSLEEQPERVSRIGFLALTKARLGEKEAALALAERAMAMNPLHKDALTGPGSIEIFARVAAQAGEPDRAIAALEKLMSIPACSGLATDVPPTPALLRLDPMFDPLRNNPRFQALTESSAAPASY